MKTLKNLILIISITSLAWGCSKGNDDPINDIGRCWQCEVQVYRGGDWIIKRHINYNGFTLGDVESMTEQFKTDSTRLSYSLYNCGCK